MKKLFVLAATLLVAVTASAQIVSSSSRSILIDDTPVKKSFYSYFKAGVAINSFNVSGAAKGAITSNIGYGWSYGFQSFFGPKGLYWGMEFGMGTRGGNIKTSDYNLLTHNFKVVPFQLGFNFEIVDRLALDIHVGVPLSLDYAGSYKSQGGSYSIANDKSLKRFDVAVAPGIALWYDSFGIDFIYQFGLVSMASETAVMSRVMLISLAYRF